MCLLRAWQREVSGNDVESSVSVLGNNSVGLAVKEKKCEHSHK